MNDKTKIQKLFSDWRLKNQKLENQNQKIKKKKKVDRKKIEKIELIKN